MAEKRWNRRSALSKAIGAIVKFFFGGHSTYSWKRRKLKGKKQLLFLVYRDVIATITGEIRGFGEWQKYVYISRRGRKCIECGTSWEKCSLEFHHKRPLKAVHKVIFKTPLKILPTSLVIILANIIANRLGNMQLLCLKCHYKAHVLLAENGHTTGAVNLVKSKLESNGIPIPKV